MPPRLHQHEQILGKLFGVFRTYGYEGASLSRIAEATGLGRASLYHHFPGGKEEMARQVLDAARAWLTENVVNSLKAPGPQEQRWRKTLENIAEGYQQGEASCVLNLLATGEAGEYFQSELNNIMTLWLTAFQELFLDAGYSPEQASESALEAVVRIEGALVVGRALGRPSVLTEVMGKLTLSPTDRS